jgi:ribosomal subunit interface protein
MQLPLHITYRDIVPLPSVEPEVRRRAAKFDQWTSDVIACHVAFEAEGKRHRQGHSYKVKVSITVPDTEIVAGTRQGNEDLKIALRDAFDAADRQLEDYARRRRGQTKSHPPVLHGRIVRLEADGTGFIANAAGDQFHFDRSHLVHEGFEALRVGQEVRFVGATSKAGPEARRIAALV